MDGVEFAHAAAQALLDLVPLGDVAPRAAEAVGHAQHAQVVAALAGEQLGEVGMVLEHDRLPRLGRADQLGQHLARGRLRQEVQEPRARQVPRSHAQVLRRGVVRVHAGEVDDLAGGVALGPQVDVRVEQGVRRAVAPPCGFECTRVRARSAVRRVSHVSPFRILPGDDRHLHTAPLRRTRDGTSVYDEIRGAASLLDIRTGREGPFVLTTTVDKADGGALVAGQAEITPDTRAPARQRSHHEIKESES